jgi:hypothetical protein
MSDAIVDIEALALRCRADRAREYINEAMQCYRAGAYRSTIVNSWIAVVFDLVDKVRELALSGDAAATAINTQYETYLSQIEAGNDQGIKSALEFERAIVHTCAARLQFFNHQQVRDLDRLREDRHQCAHPSFQRAGEPYRPVAEQARLHLRNAVEHVLSQPPIQGRAAISRLEATVASGYFPKDRAQAIVLLRGTALANPNDALVRGFVDALIFGFATPGTTLFGKIQAGTALAAVLELHRAQAEGRIANQLSRLVRDVDDANLPSVVRMLVSAEDCLLLVNETARARLAQFVRTGPLADVAGLARHAELAETAGERISTLESDELAGVIASGVLPTATKERALVLLSDAHSFNRANSIFTRLLTPLFSLLDRSDVERVIRMPAETGADLIGATGYESFIRQVRAANLIPSAELDAILRANGAEYLMPAPAVEP